jgi:hypothetical protein
VVINPVPAETVNKRCDYASYGTDCEGLPSKGWRRECDPRQRQEDHAEKSDRGKGKDLTFPVMNVLRVDRGTAQRHPESPSDRFIGDSESDRK